MKCQPQGRLRSRKGRNRRQPQLLNCDILPKEKDDWKATEKVRKKLVFEIVKDDIVGLASKLHNEDPVLWGP